MVISLSSTLFSTDQTHYFRAVAEYQLFKENTLFGSAHKYSYISHMVLYSQKGGIQLIFSWIAFSSVTESFFSTEGESRASVC